MTDPRDEKVMPSSDSSDDPQSAANQQFAHALLQTLQEQSDSDQKRVQKLMEAIQENKSSYQANRSFSTAWGITSGIAAAILVLVALVFLNGTQQTATATVYNALDAMRLAGDRTYAVSFARTPDLLFKRAPDARLDVRADDQYIFRTRTPEGHMLVAGADADGDWMLRRNGTITRSAPKHHRPRWVDLAGGSLLLASIDGLLATLPTRYELELLEPEPLSPDSTLICNRIRAFPMTDSDSDEVGLQEQIDLWIDPNTRLVRQIDFILGNPPKGPPRRHMPGPPKPPSQIGHQPGHVPPPRHRPPNHRPHAVRFQLEQQEPLPENWFQPEAHTQERPPESTSM